MIIKINERYYGELNDFWSACKYMCTKELYFEEPNGCEHEYGCTHNGGCDGCGSKGCPLHLWALDKKKFPETACDILESRVADKVANYFGIMWDDTYLDEYLYQTGGFDGDVIMVCSEKQMENFDINLQEMEENL